MPLTDAQRAFLSEPRYGTVATLRVDGTPSLFTVWYDLDGDDIWFVTRQDLAKLRHIARDPRVAFHVVDPSGYPYIAINGIATISIDHDLSKRLHMASRYRGPEGGKRYLIGQPAAEASRHRAHQDRPRAEHGAIAWVIPAPWRSILLACSPRGVSTFTFISIRLRGQSRMPKPNSRSRSINC